MGTICLHSYIYISAAFLYGTNTVDFGQTHLECSMSVLYTAQLKTCCINRHVVPFSEIQAALEDTLSFQLKTHA